MLNSFGFVQLVVALCLLFAIIADTFNLVLAVIVFLSTLMFLVWLYFRHDKKISRLLASKLADSKYEPVSVFKVNRRWKSVELLVMEQDRMVLISLTPSDKIIKYDQIKELRKPGFKYHVSLMYALILFDGTVVPLTLDEMNTKDEIYKTLNSKEHKASVALLANGLAAGSVGYSYAASNATAAEKVQRFEAALRTCIKNVSIVKSRAMLTKERLRSFILASVALLELLIIIFLYVRFTAH